MNYSNKYIGLNQQKVKGIIKFYGHKYFYMRKTCDLGSMHSDIGIALLRLGADVCAVDARQEHIKIINKKYPEIKTVKADLDQIWPFKNKKFDLILDLDLMCHLANYEKHLREVCASTHHLVLESAVLDSDDPFACTQIAENKANFDTSFNGVGCRPTAAAIERVLAECGMDFKRLDKEEFNSNGYVYNWPSRNDGSADINKRRIWFACSNSSPIKFGSPGGVFNDNQPQPYNVISLEPTIYNKVNAVRTRKIEHNIPTTQPYVPKFAIVIPAYKTEAWCIRNIQSCLSQSYQNYRIIFTDDNSPDKTFELVQDYLKDNPKKDKFTLIKNSVRVGALENLYNMIHSCDDDEIVITLDGDDWLADSNSLEVLKNNYIDQTVWMTYGQYRNYPDKGTGVSTPYPAHIISSNNFRSHRWGASHLRTFYAGLFKKINKNDLMHNGTFMSMAWDMAIMFPLLEMSGNHSRFIGHILMEYNMSNPLNDFKVNVKLQQSLDKYCRSLSKYQKLEKLELNANKPNIGLMCIATGKYDRFINGFINSADKYFLDSNYNVCYYIFTDKTGLQINTNRRYEIINIEHRPFPYASSDRFKHFWMNKEKLEKEDYLAYCDIDSLFVDKIGSEILGGLVAVQHCGYFNKQGPFENNKNSVIYADPSKYKFYAGGGFSAGESDKYLELTRVCYENTMKDEANGIINRWNDESQINYYFMNNAPDVILDIGHYPESNLEYYKRMWNGKSFVRKILLLDKDHNNIRKE